MPLVSLSNFPCQATSFIPRGRPSGSGSETPAMKVSACDTEGWCEVSQERPKKVLEDACHGLNEILASGTLRVLVVLPSRQLIDWFLRQIVTGVLAGTPFVRIMEVNHRTTP